MAEVYAASDRITGEPAALKRVSPALAAQSGPRLRFASEIELLTRCAGPHVLELYASGVWQDTPAYVSERCARSLADAGRAQLLPMGWVLRRASELLVALDRVHAVGVVHRDIKPSNVLLTDADAVRLADFGIARHPTRRVTAVGHVVGTPSYSAPELMVDPRLAAPAHDLYAVGLLILALTTHQRTWTLVEPVRRQATLNRFHEPVRRVLDRATALDPAERYGSAAEMTVDVQRALAACAG